MATEDFDSIRKNILTPENYPKITAKNIRCFAPSPDEEIVISGISGRYPNSDNVDEFSYHLYNKIDMVTDKECRWANFPSQELPKRKGVIKNITKFDATFFGVHHKQVHAMDPQGRQLIECAYEAILDSGFHPMSLRGSRTGVYVAVCFSETEKSVLYDSLQTSGFNLAGCSRAMMANRVSYCLGLQGPSFTVDTACSSSMFALDSAFSAIRTGQCDAAIVCGTNLNLHPYTTINFFRLGVLASDGYCRPFDQNASGYTRAEAICAIFLQRAKDAKRIYAKVVYSNTNCDGYKAEGITYPSGLVQEKLLREFYEDIALDPRTVNYVEAHGTGTVVGDPEECQTLDNIFCKNRKEPLLVGSVKSSIGHSEGSAGICSITKVLLAFETGLVSPNINFTEVRKDIPSLVEGRLKVCTEPTPLSGNLAAVNSFGFGGANSHALLARYEKTKINNGIPEDNAPRLILWAGRTQEAVNKIFDAIESMPLDAEFIALLHDIQQYETPGNLYRGYGIYEKGDNGSNAKCVTRLAKHFDFDVIKRPVVWMFTGMGCQWAGMGVSLMKIDIFRESIEKSHKVLQPFGLDLISIITSPKKETFDQIINSFVGIAAVQVALVDILRALEISFDYCIGHSVGELGCGYADGSLTAEQMLLAAFARGLVSYETKVIEGSMAAVGLSFNQVKSMLPDGIEIACHNSANSATLSGPKADVAAFVDELKKQEIFAKEVPCSNIPYHSKYIKEMGPKLLAKLREIIPQPKKRSQKWISSSVAKDLWETETNQFSSAEYHTNNLLSPVLFEEASTELPENAITIEIAPHGLLQSIIKKALPNGIHIPLTHRENKDNACFFLTALGKLFTNGIIMPVAKIYPPISYPVSRGTRMIGSLIKWDHSQDWFVAEYDINKTQITSERKVVISLELEDYQHISGHVIDGRCLIPATSYLHLVRETLVYMTPGQSFNAMDIEFENIRFMRATYLKESNSSINLTIVINIGSGNFEVTEGITAVVSGTVRYVKESKPITDLSNEPETDYPILNMDDFYKELRLRGYNYMGMFKSVTEIKADASRGKIKWHNNWAAFMDCLLQMNIVAIDSRALYLPTRIRKIRINTQEHLRLAAELDPENPEFETHMSRELGMIVAGGIEITGMTVNSVSRRKPTGLEVLENYRFVPLVSDVDETYTRECGAKILMQIAMENLLTPKLKIVEVIAENEAHTPILKAFDEASIQTPLVTSNLILLSNKKFDDLDHISVEDVELKAHKDSNILIAFECFNNVEFLTNVQTNLNKSIYLISRENKFGDIQIIEGFQLLASVNVDDEKWAMFQQIPKEAAPKQTVIKVKSDDMSFEWLSPLQEAVKNDDAVLVVAQSDQHSGIMGLVNCVRREPGGKKVKCIQIDDKNAPVFSEDEPLFREQLKLNLAFNVYRNGVWGTYRHLQVEVDDIEQPQSGHYYVNMLRLGDLSSFIWMQGSMDPTNMENYVNVQYSSINFRDVMMATGRLPLEMPGANRLNTQCILGFEYSGIDSTGQRLMGMVDAGSMSTMVKPIQYFTWKVPKTISLRDAATIPVVYTTVYYAFFMYNPITKGKSVLIHAGTGAIGLSAIRVALAYGMEVFTTVSTEEKKQYLLETYPELKECNIGNSRDCSFEAMIKRRTKGAGVDYVLNSLSEDKLAASLRCLGMGGTFLEIGKFDIMHNSSLAMEVFDKEITIRAVFADFLVYRVDLRKIVYELVLKDLQSGIIQPLRSTVFPANSIEKAFRYLSTGKHMGKVVLQVRETEKSKYSMPIKIMQKTYCNPELVYVIVGGLGGFGLELADWLVLRGAKKIVLSSRRGVVTGYQSSRIKIWESYGCKVRISTADITTPQGCKKLLEEALLDGQIGGIYNLAVVLQDSILENQNPDKFKKSFLPKANATRYLDELSRVLCSQLQTFVVFSSASCGRGNAGQTNYGMANSIMERIIEQRVRDKLPGKAIQFGAIGEVGLVAEMAKDKIDLEISGTIQQRISSCLNALDTLLNSNEPVVSSTVVAEKHKGGRLNVIDSVLHIMGIRDLKSISQKSSLAELGMDSLMAVEIKQALEREFDINLTAQDLRSLTFAKLQEISNANSDPASRKTLASIQNDEDVLMLFKSVGDEKTSAQTLLKANDLDPDKYDECALLIPGLEGVAGEALLKLGKNLNVPSFALQFNKMLEKTTVKEIVSSLTGDVLSLFKAKKYFCLIGHSYGAIIALELAKILERMGLKGQIISLDGSALLIKKFIEASKGGNETTDEDLQYLILRNFVFQLVPETQRDVVLNLMKDSKTYDEKLNNFIGVVRNDSYSSGYLKEIGQGMFKRGMHVVNINTDAEIPNKIQSDIKLFKPTRTIVTDIDEDYQLPKYTSGKVYIENLDGNHLTILENAQLFNILNDIIARKNF